MKIAIFCDSVTGNTSKLAKCIYETCEGHDVKIYNDFNLDMADADLVFMGSYIKNREPSDKFKKVMRLLMDKKIFIYGTCAFGYGISYYDLLYSNTKKYIPATNKVLAYFYCPGKLPYSTRVQYEARLKRRPHDEDAKEMINMFDLVLKHPDDNDLLDLELKVKMVLDAL